MIGDEPDQKMAAQVEKSIQAGDTPKPDPGGLTGPLPQRAQAKREQ
jgi:hypothetical protein